MKKKLLVGLIIIGLLIISAFLLRLVTFTDQQLIPLNDDVYYELTPGTSLRQIAQDFSNLGLLNHPIEFIVFAKLEGKSKRLQAGEYLFPRGATNGQVLDMLANGSVIQRYLTIIDGWNYQQMITATNNNPYLQHTLSKVPKNKLLKTLGYKAGSPEGMFYPDTYFFSRGALDKVILKKAYHKMQTVLATEWKNRAKDLPYKTPYEALIAASLIEKETALPKEKTLVSGVIALRLKKGMPLQIDPTVIYGMGDKYEGNITKKDLQTDTAYNTYTRRGLPPTPIAMPNSAAIHAALHPNRDGYLYFVAKGDGSHQFSKTLKAQNRAVRKYQLNQVSRDE